MPKATISLDRYVSHSMRNVPGFLRALDAQVIKTLLLHQDEAGIQGHLCEIGVHHGRLFLMLALARRAGERALAIDLFEDDSLNTNTPHAGRNGGLWKHARRLGIDLSPEEAFKTSSLQLQAGDLVARFPPTMSHFPYQTCYAGSRDQKAISHQSSAISWAVLALAPISKCFDLADN